MKSRPTLSSIRRKFVPISIGLGSIFLVLILTNTLYQLFFPSDPVLTNLPTSKIYPTQTIIVGIQGGKLSHCTLRAKNGLVATSTVDVFNRTISLSPADIWPDGITFPVELVCGNRSIDTFTVQTKAAQELTLDEQAKAQSRLDAANAKARQTYLEKHPFIDAYPLRTEEFVVRYLEKEKVLYVLVKEGISNRELLRTTVRKAANIVGTPAEIPIIFSDEFNQNSIETIPESNNL